MNACMHVHMCARIHSHMKVMTVSKWTHFSSAVPHIEVLTLRLMVILNKVPAFAVK